MRKAGLLLVGAALTLAVFVAPAMAAGGPPLDENGCTPSQTFDGTTCVDPGADPVTGPNDWYLFTNPAGEYVCHQGDPSIGTSELTFVGGPFTSRDGCVPPPPPFDQCPDIQGDQPEGTSCETETITTTTSTPPPTTTVTEVPTTTTTATETTPPPTETETTTTAGGNNNSRPPTTGGGEKEQPRKLAFTGVEDIVPIAAGALGLLTLGTSLLWFGRKKEDA